MSAATKVMSTEWDVVIVGGGAAGLSAALILARARRRVLVIDGGAPRNRLAAHVHGVLGREGSSPLDLLSHGRHEVEAVGGVIETARVASIDGADGGFSLVTELGDSIRAERVIIATGIRDELPPIAGLAENWGRGVVACPYCDGYEARGTRIGVIAGSIAGLHKAQMLRAYSSDITALTGLIGEKVPDRDVSALAARGIRVDARAIISITSERGMLTGVEFEGGSALGLDTVFVDPGMVPLDDLLQQLGADRMASASGSWASRDDSFQTSVPGVWAVGNVANPAALVSVAMAEGVTAAVAINTAMVFDEVTTALESEFGRSPTSAADHWENRYRETGPSWSGLVNAAVERELGDSQPGTALDLGCGEGGDALWLARQGWAVTAVDIAPSALAIAAAAQSQNDSIQWVAADLSDWIPPMSYDLVTSSFLHSTVELPRVDILRRAASAVAAGGQFLVVGHYGAPLWAQHAHDAHVDSALPAPDELLAALQMEPGQWTIVTSALIERPIIAPDGSTSSIVDSVLRLRRNR